RKAHLLEDKQIPSVGVFDEVYFTFGRHLEELHVTWAHLEKKRTRQQTYTNISQDNVLSSWRRRHRYNVTPSQRRPRWRHKISRREPPYPFKYLTRRLTIEEMLAKFINEGKREHEEMEIFIKEFRTTNELLLKERSNLLSELKIKVNELSKVMSNVLIPKNEVNGVTTMGGKMTSEATSSKEICWELNSYT
ncbi:hypothetical protein Tco_0257360, partial [Tanacetum coccineum]